MRFFMFIKLFKMIFNNKKLPDLDYIQKQGLLAVKIAQTFALRIDFLSEETCTHLAKLYTKTEAIKEEDFSKLMQSYANIDWFNHFESIDKKPLGSASVGQVHRARLKNGKDVVVKVIKKNFKKII